ncbi:Mast cell protease 3, partial [Galemys pyrenaicus]
RRQRYRFLKENCLRCLDSAWAAPSGGRSHARAEAQAAGHRWHHRCLGCPTRSRFAALTGDRGPVLRSAGVSGDQEIRRCTREVFMNGLRRTRQRLYLSPLPGKMQPLLLLLLLACLLPPRAEAGEIIGGHEARPHSRPYMACLRISVPESESWFGDKPFNTMRCGGFLIREDFVLTAAHCNGRSIRIILGAHDVTKQERTWQVTAVRRAIPHPDYNRENCANDIMLLQLERNAKLNDAVKIIRLPSENNSVRPGRLCTVAGWGLLGVTDQPANKLQEADLRVQKESVCLRWFPHHIYDSNIQLCAGDRRTRKASYEVRAQHHPCPVLATARLG